MIMVRRYCWLRQGIPFKQPVLLSLQGRFGQSTVASPLSRMDYFRISATLLLRGAVAQLGARLDGIEEVVGSNPIGSTIIIWSNPDT
jgi:hypothetical protein